MRVGNLRARKAQRIKVVADVLDIRVRRWRLLRLEGQKVHQRRLHELVPCCGSKERNRSLGQALVTISFLTIAEVPHALFCDHRFVAPTHLHASRVTVTPWKTCVRSVTRPL